MACHVENWPGFGTVIMCGPAFRARRCAHCGARNAKALCDWPVRAAYINTRGELVKARTCDKPCCFRCRIHPADDTDYCRDHWSAEAREDAERRGLFAPPARLGELRAPAPRAQMELF